MAMLKQLSVGCSSVLAVHHFDGGLGELRFVAVHQGHRSGSGQEEDQREREKHEIRAPRTKKEVWNGARHGADVPPHGAGRTMARIGGGVEEEVPAPPACAGLFSVVAGSFSAGPGTRTGHLKFEI